MHARLIFESQIKQGVSIIFLSMFEVEACVELDNYDTIETLPDEDESWYDVDEDEEDGVEQLERTLFDKVR